MGTSGYFKEPAINAFNTTMEDDSQHGLSAMTHIIYALYALSILTLSLTALIAIVLNYATYYKVRNTWLKSHYRWQINTFWGLVVGAFASVASGLIIGFSNFHPAFAVIPFALAFLTVCWVVYRIIRGWWMLFKKHPPLYTF